ncbi:hypothetical protein [Roseibium album]
MASSDRPVRPGTQGIAGITSPGRIGLNGGSGGHEWHAAET